MAKMQDIAEIEKNRPDLESARHIILFVEGNYYHAYDWSAWLYRRVLNAAGLDLAPSCRFIKAIGAKMPVVGYPLASFEKFTPPGLTPVPQPDGTIHFVAPDEFIPSDMDLIIARSEFEQWKESLPTEKASKQPAESDALRSDSSAVAQVVSQPIAVRTLSDVVRQILAFDVDSHTPRQCMDFVCSLKASAAQLF